MSMTDISYSEKLRQLSRDYYQNHIQLDEYRTRRKVILDKIDEEFNGRKAEVIEDDNSLHLNTIAFFKGSNID